MKKLKWILLFIMILLAAVFLFATCRKANAYAPGLDYGRTTNITMSDSNSGLVSTYRPTWSLGNKYLAYFYAGSDYFAIRNIIDEQNNTFLVTLYDSMTDLNVILSSNYNPKLVYSIDIIYGANKHGNDDYFAINIRVNYLYYSGTNAYITFNDYLFDSYEYQGQMAQEINNRYLSSTGLNICYLPSSNFSSNYFIGTNNNFSFDVLDYSLTLSEDRNDIYEDYIINNGAIYSYLYTTGYNAGYTAGYQLGYDDGQTAGYNSGYNAGYSDGVADNTTAYNHGYDDGYADGYRTGYELGLTDGDAIGYQRGLAEGMAGATPVSQTIGVVSSIFAGIGSVMAIQLFPGFPLGLLILVPLFFAVLGLILWIWRRN